MPINYVGKPPTVDVQDDITDIKAAVEDIRSASGSREETLTLFLAQGGLLTDLMTTNPTVFKTSGADVFNTVAEEIFRFTVDTPESGARTVTSLSLELAWQTKVVSAGVAYGESYWEVGSGNSPSSWVALTDTVQASDQVEDHNRSGNILPPSASALPFTLRLMGRVFVSGDALRTDILSPSKVVMTYRAA